MQDAWVALLEKGGPSSVKNPSAWLERTAHNKMVNGWRERAVRMDIEAAYCGVPPSDAMKNARAANAEKSRVFRLLNPDYYKGKYKRKPPVCGPPPPRYSKTPSGNIYIRPGRPRRRKI